MQSAPFCQNRASAFTSGVLPESTVPDSWYQDRL
jgi:hypothetical protein